MLIKKDKEILLLNEEKLILIGYKEKYEQMNKNNL
jgi:hypothetical protein